MKIFTIMIILFFTNFSVAQQLSTSSLKVKEAFDKLNDNRTNKKSQIEFVEAFPSNTETFLSVFQTENFDQLYSVANQYIEALHECSNNYPKEVIDKCISIGKNLVWDADAVGAIQHLNVILAKDNVTVFVNSFNSLNSNEQKSLIKFYADVENHNAYDMYQELIDGLNASGFKSISIMLENARTERKRQHDH